MTELKQLDIAHRFCQLLHYENTGTRAELAEKLRITPRAVNLYKQKIEEVYKVTIYNSRKRCTYYVNDADKAKLPPPI